jgi:hypothetical protein
LKKKYNDAGMKIMVSAFGATEEPTHFNPEDACTKIANWVKTNNLDGVDLDYEDNGAMERGEGEDWLIRCTKAIRAVLPVG